MQLPLTVSGNNGVVRLRLPLAVYEQSRSAALADVRVFDSAGEPVPFTFVDLAPSERVSWREAKAELFPVYGKAATLATHAELDVRITASGTLVSVRGKSNAAPPDKPEILSALILDLGPTGSGERLDSLQFARPGTDTYRAELAIDRSEDLQLWDRVAQSRVDWLQASQSAAQLVNDRIVLAGQGGRYLRIQWLEGTPLLFGGITARWRSSAAAVETPLEIVLAAAPGKVAGDLVYTAGPSIAATQVGLDLPSANMVLPASIGFYREQRNPPRTQFESIASSTFYRLTQNAVERTSSRVQIAPHASSQWVVRAPDRGDLQPALVLRWLPRTLVFTARGASNQFLLAVGAEAATTARWQGGQTSLERVAPGFSLAELSNVEQAVPGEWARNGAVPATDEPASRTAPLLQQRSVVLWAVLALGTLLLASMTWRLFRQMQQSPR